MSSHPPLLPFLAGLKSLRVLVVEDECQNALDLVQMLGRHGAVVIGPYSSVEVAMAGIGQQDRPDLAILDMNPSADAAADLAKMLTSQSIPIVLVICGDCASLPAAFHETPLLQRHVDLW